jgi:hypothetical protein
MPAVVAATAPDSTPAGPEAESTPIEPAPVSVGIVEPVSIPAPQPIDGGKDADRPSEPAVPSIRAETPPAPEAPVADPPKPPSLWPEPQALVEQLDELAVDCETGEWAMEVEQALRRLGAAMNEDQREAADMLLSRLAAFARDADALAGRLEDGLLAAKVRRAAHAIERRLAVWRPTLLAGGLRAPAGEGVQGDAGHLSACLAGVDTLTHGSPQGRAWSDYLTLDSLRTLAAGRTVSDEQARAVARAALQRLAHVPMNPRQRQFLAEKPIATLREELHRWASQPGQVREVLGHVEQYEMTASAGDGRLLAEDCRRLAMSPSAAQRQLAESLEGYYRNCNVRLAVDGRLLNQLVPDRPDECRDLDDVIGGLAVQGRSVTSAQLAVRLIRDPQRVRMALEIQGEVSALTHCVSGVATFYDDSQASYRASKVIEIGPRGMIVRPALVEVNHDLRLRDVSTDLDPIPLIGTIAQEVARSGHESRRCQMSAEAEQKVWTRAKEQVDDEVDARLGNLARRIQGMLLEPAAALSLGPAVVSAETTNDRVAMRLRLASDEQLGGNTPRPRAPADCLASVQVHQSALNNVIDQLELDGATFTFPELRERLAGRLRRPEMLRQQTDVEGAKITFAPKGAAQVQCRDGQVALILSVARLEMEPRAWEDFHVRVLYRPHVAGRSVELVREELIELEGENLNTRSQIALRGILAKAFSRQRSLPLVPERITGDPQLARLRVTQVVIEDGWLALAWGRRGQGG